MKEVLLQYVNGTKLTPLFGELFINADGSIDADFFNEVHETSESAKSIRTAIKEVGITPLFLDLGIKSEEEIAKHYSFGKFKSGKQWILELHKIYGKTFSRHSVLGWIAKQRPDKADSSFSPLGMAHIPSVKETEAL